MDILKAVEEAYDILSCTHDEAGINGGTSLLKQAIEYIEKQEPLKFTINNDPAVHTTYLVPLRELSDEEIDTLFMVSSEPDDETTVDHRKFARAIIAAAQDGK